ncbi:MAG: serine hydrolase domain-containing protein [Chitinophagaceae bacterium]
MSLKINPICLKCSFPLLFLLLWLTSSAQGPDLSNADAIIQRNQKLLGNNIILLVYKDSQLVHQKEFGVDFKAKTQAPIGAASQWITAALVMTFVDQGKISLDDPVVKYVPSFGKYMKNYVTLRSCLAHTTGIESGGKLNTSFNKKYETLEEAVDAYATKEISNNPGKEIHFGPIGPAIAARVCEVIAKKPFERLVQERITRPLKMRMTNFTNENGGAPNPAGGAVSTALDYINFMAMLLHKGVFEGKRILSEQSVAEMEKAQFAELPSKYTPKLAEGWNYGLGAWIQEKDASGNAAVVTSPGMFGTWPWIDNCRNYVAVIFVQSVLGEQKKDIYQQVKNAVDDVMPAVKCK